ncbi:MAG: LysE family translocator [Pseudomonadota bacterium]
MMVETLIPVLAAFLVVTIAPGPANIAVATVSMTHGRASGLRFGLGLGVGFAFWGLIAATGLGAVLQASAQAMIVLKLAGGCYLIWLAFITWRETGAEKTDLLVLSQKRWFLQGLLLNLSNPKAVVAWLAALAAGFGSNETLAQLLFATGLCIALGFVNYFSYALLFSLQACMRFYDRFSGFVSRTVAVFFAATGLAIVRSAFQRTP